MSRYFLALGVALALCGCSDSSKQAGPSSTAGASATAQPADAVQSAKPAAETKDAGEKEMTEAATDAAEGQKEPAAEPAAGDTAEKSEGKGKVTVDDAMQAARKAAQAGDMKGALEALETAVADNPDDANLFIQLTGLSQQIASGSQDYDLFKKSAGFFRQALKAEPSLKENPNLGRFAGNVLYNEACALAKKDGKPADALKSLQEAVDIGWEELAQLEKDEDLAAVRELPEFAEFQSKAKASIAEKMKKELDDLFTENKPFDFKFELTDIEGKSISMADLKGKVAIIDIWGTWCPPCRMEIPHFVELQTKYKDVGFEIVGLNSERVKDRDQATQMVVDFHKENNMNYRCALADNDIINQIPDMQGFPTTLFVDRTGTVRAKVVGYHDLNKLDAIVSRLLAEKTEGDKPEAEKTEGDKPAGEPKAE
ncbi:MAG: redoxin domain-containing protein [Planctomycetes bacterium]|nr:redoxin domain-containing protein [Planctomycetota bacterium]